MHLFGKVIVIKRNGADGAHFPLTANCCVFGRGLDSDIRIQLPTVDTAQCQIDIDDKEHVFIKNTSTTSSTLVNDKVLSDSLTALSHGDIITIVDRKFRFEFPAGSRFYPNKSPRSKSPKTPKEVRTSMTNLSGSGKKHSNISLHSSPVFPLSPRTDNVPASTKSHLAEKNVIDARVPVTDGTDFNTNQTQVRRSSASPEKSTSDFLFGLSPAAFYRASVTPKTLKNLPDSQEGKMSPVLGIPSSTLTEGSVSQASSKSATPIRQRSPGSPYRKTPANLRKSITDLRRSSVPVFEKEEDSTEALNTSQHQDPAAVTTVQTSRKRKSPGFTLLSAKRKRVSFGPNLSPEHFDKTLPPKTPIKKGATPGRIYQQERKSLLRSKSWRSRSTSPSGISPLKTPIKAASSPQVDAVNTAASSPALESASSVKLRSPSSRPRSLSLSQRSTQTISDKTTYEKSTGKSSPANMKSPQATMTKALKENVVSVVEFSNQEPPYSNAKVVGSDLDPPVPSPKIKSELPSHSSSPQKLLSPAFQKGVSQKSATPRRSSASPLKSAIPRRSISFPLKSATSIKSGSSPLKSATQTHSNSSPQKSATPSRSSASPQMSATPRRSSAFPQKLATPRRSSASPQKSATPRRSSASQKSATTRRSSASPQKSATPRRSSASPKKSATPRRSRASPKKSATPRSSASPQKSATPRRSSASPEKLPTPRSSASPQKSATPSRSSASPQMSATPRRSSPQKSATPRRSSASPQKSATPRRSSASPQKSATPRRSSASPQKSATPRSSSASPQKSATPSRSSASPKKSATPRRSSASPQKSATPRRSSASPQKSATPRRSSASPQKSATPRRSSASPQKSATPRRSSASPQKSATPRRSSASPQKSATPRRSSASPQKSATPSRSSASPKKSATPRRSSASPQMSATPRRSSASPEKSPTPRSSASPQKSATPSRSSASPQMSATPRRSSPQKSATHRRSRASPQKSATPRRSSPQKSAMPRSGLSPQKTPRSTVNLALPDDSENVILSTPVFEKHGETPLTIATVIETSKSPTKNIKLSGVVNLSLSPNSPMLSQDLFSQVSPKSADKGSTLREEQTSAIVKKVKSLNISGEKDVSPVGMKRVFRTPRQRQTGSAKISPSAIRRLMKTPKDKRVQISAVSPVGIKNIVKTPRLNRTNLVVNSPSGLKRLLKTPKGKQIIEASLKDIKEVLKSPGIESSDNASFSGVSSLFNSPETSKQGAASASLYSSNVTPAPRQLTKSVDTPRPGFSGTRTRSPKKFFDEIQPVKSLVSRRSVSAKSPANDTPKYPGSHRLQTEKKLSVGRPPSGKKILARLSSPTEKILSPPQDFNKVVALRAIHGHGITPKLAASKVGTPKSVKKPAANSAKKTPYKKTWSDVVKSGVQKLTTVKTGVLVSAAVTKRKSPSLIKKRVQKTPKTPRALARALAPTTGHADSPATIFVGKKALGKAKTPRPLPRKGRKVSLNKALRKSAGNISFTGLADMFTEQTESVLNESALYADIPDTPNGPNEMFVSPLSNRKQSLGARKSTNLIGVKELFVKKGKREPDFIGVKELFVPSNTSSTVSPSGLRRLMKTPKKFANGVSPTGVGRLLATPKTKGLPVSPTGVEILFKTPVNTDTASDYDTEPSWKQASQSLKSEPRVMSSNKSGARGRKRAGEPLSIPSPKKNCVSPAHKIRPLTSEPTPVRPRAVGQEKTPKEASDKPVENKAASVRRVSYRSSHSRNVDSTKPSGEEISPPAVVGGRTEVQIIEYIEETVSSFAEQAEEIARHSGKIAPSSTKTTGRGKAQIIESAQAEEESTVAFSAKTATSQTKITGRGRRGKAQIIESAEDESTVAFSAKAATSPTKITGRGRRGKAQIIESAEDECTVAFSAKAATSPTKIAGRGRRGKAQIIESTEDECTFAFSAKAATSPTKITGRGRRGKAQIVESTPVEELTVGFSGKAATSPVKTTGRGKAEIIESAPAKTTGRGRRGKAQITESAPAEEESTVTFNGRTTTSPAKTTGQGRGGKAQIMESAPAEEKSTVAIAKKAAPSPVKTTGRGRRGKAAEIIEPVPAEESTVAFDRMAATSPAKTAGRGKAEVIESAPAKTTGRGRRGKAAEIEPVPAEESTVAFDRMAATSPAKTAGRGKAEVIESAPAKTTGRGRRGKAEILESAPANTTGRGKAEVIEFAPAEEKSTVAIEGKAVASQIKTTGRGRRSNTKIVESASVEEIISFGEKTVPSAAKIGGRGTRGKTGIMEAAPFEETFAFNVKTTSSSSKTTGRGRQGRVQSAEIAAVAVKRPHAANEKTALSPSKTAGRGRRGRGQLLESAPLEDTAAVFKTVSSPIGKHSLTEAVTRGRRQQSKKESPVKIQKGTTPVAKVSKAKGVKLSVPASSAASTPLARMQEEANSPVLQKATKTAPTNAPGATRKRKGTITESILSPAKSRSTRRGAKSSEASYLEEPVVSAVSVSVSQEEKQSGVKRKAGKTAAPEPPKKIRIASPVQIAPAKLRATQRSKNAHVFANEESSPVKVFSQSRRGQVKKAATVAKAVTLPGKSVSPVRQTSPAKGRRGQLKKAVSGAAVPRRKEMANAAESAPKSVAVSNLNKKKSNAASAKSGQTKTALALPKSTVANRRTKLQK